jgi:hypothetical protein
MTATTRTPDLPHEKLLSRENSRKDGPFGVSGPSSINRRLEPTISELGNRRNEEQAPALAALALSVRSWLVPGEDSRSSIPAPAGASHLVRSGVNIRSIGIVPVPFATRELHRVRDKVATSNCRHSGRFTDTTD